MAGIIEFFFDFSSPYGYFASHKIESIAKAFEREAVWKPIMLGPALQKTGSPLVVDQPVKGEYVRYDFERLARYMDVPWAMPDPFPVKTVPAARAFYWIEGESPDVAKPFARAIFKAYYADGRNISEKNEVVSVAKSLGVDEDALVAALDDEKMKKRLFKETDGAFERGVFGSPFFIVDGERFWGADRMWMVKKWLDSGGW
jgi:2-hydroxychromene-2-carboxylate isomerase